MAFNSRFVSIKSTVEAVYRDSGIDNVDMETAVADTLELLGAIGLTYNYIDKVTDGTDAPLVEVSNFRAYLPYDVQQVIAIRKAVLASNGDILSSQAMVETADLFPSQHTPETTLIPLASTAKAFAFSQDENTDELIVEDKVVVGTVAATIPTGNYTYKIQNEVIYTNFENGYLMIAYRGYPVDEEGWLMIPDDEKYKLALKFHLIYKIDYRRWRAWPEKPAYKALLNDSEQQRDFYVAAARNKAHIPTIDKMEAIKNQYLRSIPKINEHSNGFRTINISERRKF